jgi:hypothetical protein
LSRLQHAAVIGFSHEKSRINNRLSILFMGGTVVAEYQACSKCFAGSVPNKKTKKRYAADFRVGRVRAARAVDF